jgi:hypothetical protein
MNHDNRVLGRRGARELTPSETEHVTGSVRTQTKCSLAPRPDGDTFLGEC